MINIFLITGEPSGDTLGAKLMRAIKAQAKDPVIFHGLGGDQMQAEGLQSLFPITELSVMGFAEVVPHIPKLLRRISETADAAKRIKPDVVITIDSPDFSFRVAKKLQGAGIPLIHYVAPSVWAYRAKRAAKIAKLYNHLLALLPFEPPYFENEGLPTTFVGHPLVEDIIHHGNAEAFRTKHAIALEVELLCVLPGSRQGEIKRLWPIYRAALQRLRQSHPTLHLVIPTIPARLEVLRRTIGELDIPYTLVTDSAERKDAYAACTAALAKSGTITTELALAELPMIVAYKMHPISGFILRHTLKIKYVTLINLVLNRLLVPEFLQDHCTAKELSLALHDLLRDQRAQREQKAGFKEALQQLGRGRTPSPSEKAADVVLKVIKSV